MLGLCNFWKKIRSMFSLIKPAPEPESTLHDALHQRHKPNEGGSASGSITVGHKDQSLINPTRGSTSASLKNSGHPIYQD